MRALSDKWNPRLWLREWLNRPSLAELEERRAAEAAAKDFFLGLEQTAAPARRYSLKVLKGVVVGTSSELSDCESEGPRTPAR